MNEQREVTATLAQTRELAKKLAGNALPGDCYCLIGDLGAGKTEFARAFIRGLCGDVNVASPTFNILQIYETSDFGLQTSVYHFDLYRLKDESELAEIGLEDAFDKGITLIEWPQIAQKLLPEKRVEIRIEILDEDRREIVVSHKS